MAAAKEIEMAYHSNKIGGGEVAYLMTAQALRNRQVGGVTGGEIAREWILGGLARPPFNITGKDATVALQRARALSEHVLGGAAVRHVIDSVLSASAVGGGQAPVAAGSTESDVQATTATRTLSFVTDIEQQLRELTVAIKEGRKRAKGGEDNVSVTFSQLASKGLTSSFLPGEVDSVAQMLDRAVSGVLFHVAPEFVFNQTAFPEPKNALNDYVFVRNFKNKKSPDTPNTEAPADKTEALNGIGDAIKSAVKTLKQESLSTAFAPLLKELNETQSVDGHVASVDEVMAWLDRMAYYRDSSTATEIVLLHVQTKGKSYALQPVYLQATNSNGRTRITPSAAADKKVIGYCKKLEEARVLYPSATQLVTAMQGYLRGVRQMVSQGGMDTNFISTAEQKVRYTLLGLKDLPGEKGANLSAGWRSGVSTRQRLSSQLSKRLSQLRGIMSKFLGGQEYPARLGVIAREIATLMRSVRTQSPAPPPDWEAAVHAEYQGYGFEKNSMDFSRLLSQIAGTDRSDAQADKKATSKVVRQLAHSLWLMHMLRVKNRFFAAMLENLTRSADKGKWQYRQSSRRFLEADAGRELVEQLQLSDDPQTLSRDRWSQMSAMLGSAQTAQGRALRHQGLPRESQLFLFAAGQREMAVRYDLSDAMTRLLDLISQVMDKTRADPPFDAQVKMIECCLLEAAIHYLSTMSRGVLGLAFHRASVMSRENAIDPMDAVLRGDPILSAALDMVPGKTAETAVLKAVGLVVDHAESNTVDAIDKSVNISHAAIRTVATSLFKRAFAKDASKEVLRHAPHYGSVFDQVWRIGQHIYRGTVDVVNLHHYQAAAMGRHWATQCEQVGKSQGLPCFLYEKVRDLRDLVEFFGRVATIPDVGSQFLTKCVDGLALIKDPLDLVPSKSTAAQRAASPADFDSRNVENILQEKWRAFVEELGGRAAMVAEKNGSRAEPIKSQIFSLKNVGLERFIKSANFEGRFREYVGTSSNAETDMEMQHVVKKVRSAFDKPITTKALLSSLLWGDERSLTILLDRDVTTARPGVAASSIRSLYKLLLQNVVSAMGVRYVEYCSGLIYGLYGVTSVTVANNSGYLTAPNCVSFGDVVMGVSNFRTYQPTIEEWNGHKLQVDPGVTYRIKCDNIIAQMFGCAWTMRKKKDIDPQKLTMKSLYKPIRKTCDAIISTILATLKLPDQAVRISEAMRQAMIQITADIVRQTVPVVPVVDDVDFQKYTRAGPGIEVEDDKPAADGEVIKRNITDSPLYQFTCLQDELKQLCQEYAAIRDRQWVDIVPDLFIEPYPGTGIFKRKYDDFGGRILPCIMYTALSKVGIEDHMFVRLYMDLCRIQRCETFNPESEAPSEYFKLLTYQTKGDPQAQYLLDYQHTHLLHPKVVEFHDESDMSYSAKPPSLERFREREEREAQSNVALKLQARYRGRRERMNMNPTTGGATAAIRSSTPPQTSLSSDEEEWPQQEGWPSAPIPLHGCLISPELDDSIIHQVSFDRTAFMAQHISYSEMMWKYINPSLILGPQLSGTKFKPHDHIGVFLAMCSAISQNSRGHHQRASVRSATIPHLIGNFGTYCSRNGLDLPISPFEYKLKTQGILHVITGLKSKFEFPEISDDDILLKMGRFTHKALNVLNGNWDGIKASVNQLNATLASHGMFGDDDEITSRLQYAPYYDRRASDVYMKNAATIPSSKISHYTTLHKTAVLSDNLLIYNSSLDLFSDNDEGNDTLTILRDSKGHFYNTMQPVETAFAAGKATKETSRILYVTSGFTADENESAYLPSIMHSPEPPISLIASMVLNTDIERNIYDFDQEGSGLVSVFGNLKSQKNGMFTLSGRDNLVAYGDGMTRVLDGIMSDRFVGEEKSHTVYGGFRRDQFVGEVASRYIPNIISQDGHGVLNRLSNLYSSVLTGDKTVKRWAGDWDMFLIPDGEMQNAMLMWMVVNGYSQFGNSNNDVGGREYGDDWGIVLHKSLPSASSPRTILSRLLVCRIANVLTSGYGKTKQSSFFDYSDRWCLFQMITRGLLPARPDIAYVMLMSTDASMFNDHIIALQAYAGTAVFKHKTRERVLNELLGHESDTITATCEKILRFIGTSGIKPGDEQNNNNTAPLSLVWPEGGINWGIDITQRNPLKLFNGEAARTVLGRYGSMMAANDMRTLATTPVAFSIWRSWRKGYETSTQKNKENKFGTWNTFKDPPKSCMFAAAQSDIDSDVNGMLDRKEVVKPIYTRYASQIVVGLASQLVRMYYKKFMAHYPTNKFKLSNNDSTKNVIPGVNQSAVELIYEQTAVLKGNLENFLGNVRNQPALEVLLQGLKASHTTLMEQIPIHFKGVNVVVELNGNDYFVGNCYALSDNFADYVMAFALNYLTVAYKFNKVGGRLDAAADNLPELLLQGDSRANIDNIISALGGEGSRARTAGVVTRCLVDWLAKKPTIDHLTKQDFFKEDNTSAFNDRLVTHYRHILSQASQESYVKKFFDDNLSFDYTSKISDVSKQDYHRHTWVASNNASPSVFLPTYAVLRSPLIMQELERAHIEGPSQIPRSCDPLRKLRCIMLDWYRALGNVLDGLKQDRDKHFTSVLTGSYNGDTSNIDTQTNRTNMFRSLLGLMLHDQTRLSTLENQGTDLSLPYPRSVVRGASRYNTTYALSLMSLLRRSTSAEPLTPSASSLLMDVRSNPAIRTGDDTNWAERFVGTLSTWKAIQDELVSRVDTIRKYGPAPTPRSTHASLADATKALASERGRILGDPDGGDVHEIGNDILVSQAVQAIRQVTYAGGRA